MKKTFVAATAALMLAGAATTASATTFTGSYSASGNVGSDGRHSTADGQGLPLTIADATPDYYSFSQHQWINGNQFSFNLNAPGQSQDVSLFFISTPSSYLDGNDGTPMDFSLTFNFTKPQGATGGVDGSTQGVSVPISLFGHYIGDSQEGVLTWDNGGDTTLNFGSFGNLLVHLDDVTFNQGFPNLGLGWAGGTASAKFTLEAPTTSAVPEPMSWALMLAGFFGLGAAVRTSRRRAAFTAA